MRLLKINNYTVKQGSNIILPVILQGATNDEVACGFSIKFDPKILTLSSRIELGDGVPADSAFEDNLLKASQGQFGIEIDSMTVYPKRSSTNVIMFLRFKVNTTTEKTTKIQFTNIPSVCSFSDLHGNLLDFKTQDSTLYIK